MKLCMWCCSWSLWNLEAAGVDGGKAPAGHHLAGGSAPAGQQRRENEAMAPQLQATGVEDDSAMAPS